LLESRLLKLEILIVALSVAAATIGYVADIPTLALCGLLTACVSLGILLAKALLGGSSPPSPPSGA
jgi:hypothetical protein